MACLSGSDENAGVVSSLIRHRVGKWPMLRNQSMLFAGAIGSKPFKLENERAHNPSQALA
jgi:hypothetical protein